MKKRLQDILHKYKVEAFKVSHNHDRLEEVTQECLDFSDDALKNAYHYHFHKLPDADRVGACNQPWCSRQHGSTGARGGLIAG